MWRTTLVVFAIASAGAVTALLAEALFNGSAWGRPRSVVQSPLASPLAPAPDPSPAVGAPEHPREIVLRIRIDATGDGPPLVVAPDDAQGRSRRAGNGN
jgi:hypothetical protein